MIYLHSSIVTPSNQVRYSYNTLDCPELESIENKDESKKSFLSLIYTDALSKRNVNTKHINIRINSYIKYTPVKTIYNFRVSLIITRKFNFNSIGLI